MRGRGQGQEDARRRGAVLRVRRPAPVGASARPSTAASPPTAPPSASTPSSARKRAIDIANALGCKRHRPVAGARGHLHPRGQGPDDRGRRASSMPSTPCSNTIRSIRILGEMKPNEPMDQAYLPTPGHFLALCYRTAEPSRVRRADRVGPFDPGRPRSVRRHGLRPLARQALERPPQRPERPEIRPGQDRSARSICGGRSTQVWVLERGGYDGCIGLDVKADAHHQRRRSDAAPGQQPERCSCACWRWSADVDAAKVEAFRAERDYEGLEMFILAELMGS